MIGSSSYEIAISWAQGMRTAECALDVTIRFHSVTQGTLAGRQSRCPMNVAQFRPHLTSTFENRNSQADNRVEGYLIEEGSCQKRLNPLIVANVGGQCISPDIKVDRSMSCPIRYGPHILIG